MKDKNKKGISTRISKTNDLRRIVFGSEDPVTLQLYIILFNIIPNILKLRVSDLNHESAFTKLKKIYPGLEQNIAKMMTKNYRNSNKIVNSNNSTICWLKDELLVYFHSDAVEICFSKKVEKKEIIFLKKLFLSSIKIKPEENKKFSMIKIENSEFNIQEFDVRNTALIIEDNYNDELIELHPKIVSFINNEEKHGLMLLHGDAGGGKTTYLRYLISICKTRFIYLPNNIFAQLSDPNFFTFILNYPNSVIVLEDCEELLKPRSEMKSNDGISTLLNLGDGLLGDALKLKIICTFNTALVNIDQALLRKGRLAHRYEFGALSVEKSNALLKKMNTEIVTMQPMTLADIYNYSEENGNKKAEDQKKKIGYS